MGALIVTALLDVQNVSVSFKHGEVQLFRDLSFAVQPGEVAVIVGDSGSGKTTLLHLIAGFVRPYVPPRSMSEFLWRGVFPVPRDASIRATISIAGKDVTELPPSERDIGLVMQRFSLYPNMSAMDNLRAPLRARGLSRADAEEGALRIAEQLHMNFPLERRPNELSGGQSQRVAIGKLLARDPLLALCDEAFSNLDWKLRQMFRKDVIHELKNRTKNGVRCGVLFVSHDLEDAREADTIIYLERSDEDAHTGKPTRVRVFAGGRDVAWDTFRRETKYHVVQLVSVSTNA